MRDEQRDDKPTEDAWNPGGVGNAAGADLATSSSAWNPGGAGNATEGDEDQPDVSTEATTGTLVAERHGSTAPEPVNVEEHPNVESGDLATTGQ